VYLKVNQEFSALAGWPVSMIVGRTAVDLGLWCSALDRKQFQSDLQSHGAGTSHLHRRDGTVRLTRWAAQPVAVDGTQALFVVAFDITDAQQTDDPDLTATPHVADLLSSPRWRLTPREVDVAVLVYGGYSSAQIADRLGITTHAVTYHRYNTRRKLGLNDRRTNLMLHLRHLAAEARGDELDKPGAVGTSRSETSSAALTHLAHEINNLLMSIVASTELLRLELERGVSPLRWIDEIDRTAARLTTLAAQRLGHSPRHRDASASPQPKTAQPTSCEDLTGATILVVDDDPAVRSTFVGLLGHIGCSVIAADGGKAAVHAIRDNSAIDCVLLDYAMPDMDGEATLERIRIHRPDLPVAIVSGLPPESIRRKITSGEVQHVLAKPVRLSQLQSTLQGLLGKPDTPTDPVSSQLES
jgi:DNA-binding NarL/FixJ family response regulator